MFSDDQISTFHVCPRCEERAYECFKTHAYCASCNYSQVAQSDLASAPKWAIDALREENKKQSARETATRAPTFALTT